jgi:NADH:ubiquinone reductase (H+-translocating)
MMCKHRKMELVIDLGPRQPVHIQLSGILANAVTGAYHLYAIPRFVVIRWAECFDGAPSLADQSDLDQPASSSMDVATLPGNRVLPTQIAIR